MEPTDSIVLTSPGHPDPSLAIAVVRAGALGILDLETTDHLAAQAALARLEQFTAGPFGVRLGVEQDERLTALLGQPPARLAWLLLTGGDHPRLPEWVARARERRIGVLLEAVSLAEAKRGEELGVAGILLKGHEAGGRVGNETTFLLLQRWRQHRAEHPEGTTPVYAWGGVGPNTAAACLEAGAAGVVLDAQVLLARESPLGEAKRQRLAASDGSETVLLGERLGEAYRCFARPGEPAIEALTRVEEQLLADDGDPVARRAEWRRLVRRQVGEGLWLVGQDAGLARPLAERFVTVAGIVRAIAEQAHARVTAARRLRPLAEGAPLAASHGTRYPILQGPMTRVSDTAPFAEAVAEAGALPFLALALLRKAETERLLAETRDRLRGRPWGVGILGFVPPEIRQEQLTALRACKPPYALIAGGRPDQARELEAQGIPTYLHVPSPGLLKRFLRDGARRFIFEGRECGGHVGPRTSFVLWETMLEVLREHLGGSGRGDELHVVFAGGIHDGPSAAMVAALSAGLAERGVKVGVLMGTAYLFTHEAVAAGAIVPRFQQAALGCHDTVLLESGPGHAIRCVPTPYAEVFAAEKRKLQVEGRSPAEIAKALEWMNLGRLRVASKGKDRPAGGNGPARLVELSDAEQYERGMYMIGQVAGLRRAVVSMADLHAEVCGTGIVARGAWSVERENQDGSSCSTLHAPRATILHAPPPCDVAIIGMACFYPRAAGVDEYWQNVLAKVQAVTEIPASHWDWSHYYDPDPRARDKIVSKWGAFLEDVAFDPLVFGITPKSLSSIEPLQLLLLEAVRQAIADAGYADRPFERERTAAMLGVGGGGGPLSVSYGFRACMPLLDTVPGLPMYSTEVLKKSEEYLPEWTEDSFPGILLNVAAGRIANRFNFGGPNMAIDAACGSSLAALQAGVRELEMGTSDMAVVMGADTVQTPFAYMAFSKTHALSPRGRCRPFDAAADGIVLSEGIGVAILKRLADAERDGDRIYAIVKGVGSSSDGRDKGLTAPRAEGQLRALRRAYAQARVSPARIGLVEAHGTGTVVGDQTEAQALGQIFREAGGDPQSCALGSVKSMIGHSKCAAGLAGLIKTTLALYHKILPPTLVEKPNPRAHLDDGPLFLNTEARPWVHGTDEPRRAGVSAFGFGGTNFHVVLEEHTGDFLDRPQSGLPAWPADLFVWRQPDRAALTAAVRHCRDALAEGARPTPGDLAASLWQACKPGTDQPTLAVVATSLDDLRTKLDAALPAIKAGPERWQDPRGAFFAERPGDARGTVAFLFPGQGSQYPDMLAQVGMAFPEAREVFDRAERGLTGLLDRPLGRFVYPPSAFTPEQEQEARSELMRPEVAQPAIGAAGLAMARLLGELGVEADFLAGHSYGEYVALAAAGALDPDDLPRLSYRRGAVIRAAAGHSPGGMAAVEAGPEALAELLAGLADVQIANCNAPTQTVVSGTEDGVTAAVERLTQRGVRAQRLAVGAGFHSPLVAAARGPLEQALAEFRFAAPRKPVFANATARPYPAEPAAVAAQLADHLTAPVLFQNQVEAMYAAGARVFVEVGPQGVLTGLVGSILGDRPHLAVASDLKGRPGLPQLATLLVQLLVHGVPVRLDRLFQGRGLQPFDPARLDKQSGVPVRTPTTWMVNSVRNRPLNAPEPKLLGQARPTASTPPAASVPISSPVPPVTRTPMTQPHEPAPAPRPPDPTPSGNGAPSANGHHPPAFVGDEVARVMLRYQEVMARFLDTQKSVMLGYLQGAPGPVPASVPAVSRLPVAVPTPNGNGRAPPARLVRPPPASTARPCKRNCSIWSASAPAIRRKCSTSTSTWRPTSASTRSSASRSSAAWPRASRTTRPPALWRWRS